MIELRDSADDSRVVRFARAELTRYLEQITGRPTGRPGDRPAFVGLRSLLPDEVAARLPAAAPGHDGYVLHVDGDLVVIAGDTERGVLYGVYDLLERCGCRWHVPVHDPDDEEDVPANPDLALPAVSVAEAGGFEFRVAHPGSMLFSLHPTLGMAQVDWAAKARYNGLAFLLSAAAIERPAQALEGVDPALLPGAQTGAVAQLKAATALYKATGVVDAARDRGLFLEGPLHCGITFLPNELFDEHPEWFGIGESGEREQQRPLGPEFCWSNPDAVATFAANVADWIREFPFVDVFAFTPNDGGRPCLCASCAAEPPSDWYARLANAIKEALEQAGLPRPVEITGAYAPCDDPPTPGILHPDIRVHWAHWGRRWDDHYGDEKYSLRANLDAWLARPHPLTMVEYHCSGFANPSIHAPMARQLGIDQAWLRENGAAGDLQLMNDGLTKSWWNGAFQAWTTGMAAYYGDRDPVSFTVDIAKHHFGPAAAPAIEAMSLLLEDEYWLTWYTSGGGRWTGPDWAKAADAVAAVPLLERIASLLDEAEAAVAADRFGRPVYAWRLARWCALYRLYVAGGLARADYQPVIHEASAALASGVVTPELVERVRACLVREREVLDPLVAAVCAVDGLGSSDLRNKLGSDTARVEATLAQLEAVLSGTVTA